MIFPFSLKRTVTKVTNKWYAVNRKCDSALLKPDFDSFASFTLREMAMNREKEERESERES